MGVPAPPCRRGRALARTALIRVRRGAGRAAWRRPRSWTLQEPQIERREHQDNPDVYYQPLPEVVPEEQDVHADHDGYQREHVKHDGRLSSHRFVLLCAPERSKSGACGPPRLSWRPRHLGCGELRAILTTCGATGRSLKLAVT